MLLSKSITIANILLNVSWQCHYAFRKKINVSTLSHYSSSCFGIELRSTLLTNSITGIAFQTTWSIDSNNRMVHLNAQISHSTLGIYLPSSIYSDSNTGIAPKSSSQSDSHIRIEINNSF